MNFPRLPRLAVAALALGLTCLPRTAWSQPSPAKLAGNARFDLKANEAAKGLDRGRLLRGIGTIQRPNWLPEDQQGRAYTVNFPISRLGWREVAVQFVPAASGEVILTLMGPWEEASRGVLYRQEVLWDDLRVEGAVLANGGFESGTTGWISNGGSILRQSPEVRAVSGSHYARTWHNQTLETVLKVTAGQPVTIHAHARAARPEGFQEMRRITRTDTPAHRAARRFLRGVNLGNGLEVPPGQNWAVRHSAQDLTHIKAEGFDHVRIPIGWHHYAGPGPEFRLDPAIFRKVDALVTPALRDGLNVMINIHHFEEFTSDPNGQAAKFYAIWRQIADHYAKAPEGLAFELLNEPKDAATTQALNPILAEAIRQIRKTNPGRTIVVGPGLWNGIGELPNLRLPDNDLNLIVSVHCYDPFQFTHQGADWAGNSPDRRVPGIVFPGPPRTPLVPDPQLNLSAGFRDWIRAYNTEPSELNPSSERVLKAAVERIAEWSRYYGRPVHLGEFGAYTAADPASRANYYRAFREALESAGIGWAIWDWKAGFRYWDERTKQPEPGMREALFGQPTRTKERPAIR
ncbi:MAG: glycoside hydrolase family 5 protein [Isosphaeraceae bacterium]